MRKVTDGSPLMASVSGNCLLVVITDGAVLSNVTLLPSVVAVTGVPATPAVLEKLILNGTRPDASVACIVYDAL